MITINPLYVLIADDEESINKSIKHMLGKIGHKVVGIALNGNQAIQLSGLLKPDVILMDIEMPELDGIEAARIIQEKCPIPVVLLTSHNNSELVRRASEVGVGAYLLKPPSAQEIERAMTIAVARFADLAELRSLNMKLTKAMENVKVLTGLLPICGNCKKIRDDKGYWKTVEEYIMNNSEVHFSHGICPECIEKYYPEYNSRGKKK
jgi:two-component system, response regulator PdtaR